MKVNIGPYPENGQQRKVEIEIDKYDTWDMNHTLALIIVPMLKQLKKTNHGSPMVSDEDVPHDMRYGDTDDFGIPLNIHERWDWVMREMIWAFETHIDDEWENQFWIGNPDESQLDIEALKKNAARRQRAFELFGKYFQNLWD